MSRDPEAGLPDHDEYSGLLPWYVNGTLGDLERQHLDAHLQGCESCRDELQRERLIHLRVSADPGIEYLPGPSLKRLQARLDGLRAPSAPAPEPAPDAGRSAASRSSVRAWRQLAAVVAFAAITAFALSQRWTQWIASSSHASYRTVTTSAARAPGEVIRAVFAPSITLVQLQRLLDESQLRIVSGPTEAGVYSLARTSSLPVASSLSILRRHPGVRFAESTLPPPPAPTNTDTATGRGSAQ